MAFCGCKGKAEKGLANKPLKGLNDFKARITRRYTRAETGNLRVRHYHLDYVKMPQ